MLCGKPAQRDRDAQGNPQQIRVQFEELIFDSCFDSGNLFSACRIKEDHYQLWIAPDCANTPKENKNRTWFYFSVESKSLDQTVQFTIKNMNFQERLFREGFLPVFRVGEAGVWKRIPNKTIKIDKNEGGIEITFAHQFELSQPKTFFAFTYPWSYADNKGLLDLYQEELEGDGFYYFFRNTLVYSKEGRNVELLVISSQKNRMPYRESPMAGLFPADPLNTPYTFMDKKAILVTARVHPGEVPSSHIFNGILSFLLRKDDAKVSALLDNFVFYLVPMLNPDGVSRGHYRTDSLGQNLNRFYGNPNIYDHPPVYAVKELALQLNKTKKLAMYFDLHAHASKRGCFVYGNSLEFREQIKNCLLPKLIELNTPYFDYDSCNFTEKNMYSKGKSEEGAGKEGSSRVALWKLTNLVNCYTVECNYNSIPLRDKGSYRESFIQSLTKKAEVKAKQGNLTAYDFLDISKFEDIGRAICVSILDFYEINPESVLLGSKFLNFNFLRLHTASSLIREMPYRFDPDLRKVMKNLGSELGVKQGLQELLALIDKNAEREFLLELKRQFPIEERADGRLVLPVIPLKKPPPLPLKKKSLIVPRNLTLTEREATDILISKKPTREATPIRKRVNSLTPAKL